jgi:Flp pilus assembly protein TadG
MARRHRHARRRGATLVEAAIVYPVVLLLVLGVIVVGLGLFRFNQMAELAREGARWASVRGSQFASDTGKTAASSTDVANYVKGLAAGLDPNSLTVTTTWTTSNALTHKSGNLTVKNTVSVTVSYPWLPEAYLGGTTFTLTSTSVVPMSY